MGTTVIEKLMAEKRLSVKDLAKQSGISQWPIYAAIKGLGVSDQTRTAVSQVLGCDPEALGAVSKKSRRGRLAKPSGLACSQGLLVREQDALCDALYRARKTRGFSANEVGIVCDWAKDVRRQSEQLKAVLDGKAGIDVAGGRVQLAPIANPASVPPPVRPMKPSFATAAQQYVDGIRGGLTKAYVKDIEAGLENFRSTLGLALLEDISPKAFDQVVVGMFKTNESPSKISRHANAIKNFYEWAERKGFVKNPIPEKSRGLAAHLRRLKSAARRA
jgi:hypothetical protein